MTRNNFLTARPIHLGTLYKFMFAGGLIALAIISFFLYDALQAGTADPNWGKYWMVRPLVIVPLAGAAGGGFIYFMYSRFQGGWAKILLTLLGIIGFIIALWLGTVIGLDGTYWN